jgi:CSLREA domain-containing protein
MTCRNLIHYDFRGTMKTISTKLFYAFISVCLMIVLTGVKPAYADAANLTVTKTEDTSDGVCDTDCSLREAITVANNNGSSPDVITFSGNYTISLDSQLPLVTSPITITGNGAANTIIQANTNPNVSTYRIFNVFRDIGDLTLNNLTVQNGRCNGSCQSAPEHGGAIYNGGILTINNSVLSNNSSSYAGGGVFNNGTLTINNSMFSGNTASYGGAVYNVISTLTITNSTFVENSATVAGGGVFNSYSETSIMNSTFSSNAAEFGGDIWQVSDSAILRLYNNILANSTRGGNCVFRDLGTVNGSNNLIEDASNACGFANGTNGNIIGLDPHLGVLTGSPAYFPLNTDSPALDAGDDTICAAAPVSNTSQNGTSRTQGAHCDIGAFEKLVMVTLTLKSVNTNDGWILESTETSGNGGTLDSTAINFSLGDDAANKQYRAILHFDTSGLPDNAVITSATLKIKQQGVVGTDPFTLLGDLKASVRTPAFGTDTLALSDFKSAPGKNNVATFSNTPVSNWYSALVNNTGRVYINRLGTTQFRLAFTTDDNNDNGADLMKFFSGDAGAANRPQLVIEYYVP